LGELYEIDNGEKVKSRRLVTGRSDETLVAKTADGNVTVVLKTTLRLKSRKGLGLRKAQMSFTALIPGLRISVTELATIKDG
jgi:hypothetical protein